MNDELKACPFCCGEAEMFAGNVSGKRYAWCECLNCGVSTVGFFDSDEDARIKKAAMVWNRRANDE